MLSVQQGHGMFEAAHVRRRWGGVPFKENFLREADKEQQLLALTVQPQLEVLRGMYAQRRFAVFRSDYAEIEPCGEAFPYPVM